MDTVQAILVLHSMKVGKKILIICQEKKYYAEFYDL